jgi:hypothetical protein
VHLEFFECLSARFLHEAGSQLYEVGSGCKGDDEGNAGDLDDEVFDP